MVTFMIGIVVGILLLAALMRLGSIGDNDRSKHEIELEERLAELGGQLKQATMEYQVLVLADDFFSEMQYRKNRLAQLRFEVLNVDNDFTELWTNQERAEMAHTADVILKRDAKDYEDNHQERCPVVIELGSGAPSERGDAVGSGTPSKRASWEPRVAAGGLV